MRSVLFGAGLLVLAAASAARADLTIANAGTWRLDAHLRVTACLAGQCDRDQAQSSDEVFLSEGTIVQIMLQVFSCDIAAEDYCDLVPRRNGKLKVVKCDKGAIRDVLRSCSPYPVGRVQRVSGFERMAADGQSFKWKAVIAFSIRAQGHTVSVNAVATVDGTLVAPAMTSADTAPLTLDVAPDASALVESVIADVLGR
jgi:hypothetical protein